jgi:predicted DNA binding protein
VIELQFIVPSESWISTLCSNNSAKVRVLSIKLNDSKRNITHFVEITSKNKTARNLAKELRGSNTVTESKLSIMGKNRIVGNVTSDDCKVGLIILRPSRKIGFLGIASALTVTNSRISYKLYMNGFDVPEFLQTLHEGGISYKISMIERLAATKGLTAMQKRVLKSALELGHYDKPKRVSTHDLANKMDLLTSAVSEILRISEKAIFSKGKASPLSL